MNTARSGEHGTGSIFSFPRSSLPRSHAPAWERMPEPMPGRSRLSTPLFTFHYDPAQGWVMEVFL